MLNFRDSMVGRALTYEHFLLQKKCRDRLEAEGLIGAASWHYHLVMRVLLA